MKRVDEVMTRTVSTIGSTDSLTAAARTMEQADVGFLAVVEGNRITGTITDRDIVCRFVAGGGNMDNTPVRTIMSDGAECLREDATVHEAARLMAEAQIRRVPVLSRDKRLIGVVSLDDLAIRLPQDEVVHAALQGVSRPH